MKMLMLLLEYIVVVYKVALVDVAFDALVFLGHIHSMELC